MEHRELTGNILACAFDVMRELGQGFLESVYEKSLAFALMQKGFQVETQKPLTVLFRGQVVGKFYADLVVNKDVLVELKVATALVPENQAQVINYLRATGLQVGLLINFGNSRLQFRRLTRDLGIPAENERKTDIDGQDWHR